MMKRVLKRGIQLFLSFAMVMTMFPSTMVSVFAESQEQDLVNIAAQSDVTVSNGNENDKHKIIDGDPATIWAAGRNGWPATIEVKLPENSTNLVKKIVVRFEQNKPNWSMDVKLEHFVDNDKTNPVLDKVQQGQPFKDAFVVEYEEPQAMTHALITLDHPMNGDTQGQFWPGLAEVEIWAEDSGSHTEDDINLAPSAMITSVGGSAGAAQNLVDENYSSLYVFYNGALSSIEGEAWVQADLGNDAEVSSLEIAFEKKDPDTSQFEFIYSIYGMSSKDTDWTALVQSAHATRVDNIKEHVLDHGNYQNLSKIKVVIEDIKKTAGDPWPAIAELKIFGKEKEISDPDNIAWNKPAHTNTNGANGAKITDGNTATSWSGTYFPGYVDIDLEENYHISDIEVYLPASGYSQYDIYTSMDGRDFTKLTSKTDKQSTPATGDHFAVDTEARIVRLYMNYQSLGNNVFINEVRMFGEKSNTARQEVAPIEIESFNDSAYAVEISEDMVFEEVKGIITRQLGEQYVDWFTFALANNPHATDYDYFTLENADGKIQITGNNGVSLATGLNHYLKYVCNVNISQVGNQVKMPASLIPLEEEVFKETKLPVRYAYNYCTHSYSMPFWGETEWRNELDWLALNGVNLVLDLTGQEEVWRRFLGELGYSSDEAKDFISGPAYYAWAYMANLSNYGGPVHDTWFNERVDLARKNQLAMRTLGMKPILQGYSGMVPTDIETKDSKTKGETITQGSWSGFQRPSMLKTTSPIYNEYAAKFYEIQKEVYGDVTNYYATDPFHEGGITGNMNLADISRIILDEMIQADEDAVWVIQSWQKNPTPDLLSGIGDRKEHALILDLWAENDPRWDGDSSYGYQFPKEFGNTPWVWCMLNNFGGRPGLKGYIDVLINDLPDAYNQTEHMTGIGITPEASYNNPVIYDLFFETIWVDDASKPMAKIDKDAWLKKYVERRYGSVSESAKEAWAILDRTVYNSAVNNNGEGPVCSVINARPSLTINNVSCCDSTTIKYDKKDLEEAARLMLEDYDVLSESDGYQYDLAAVLLQVLANTAQEYQKKMSAAFTAKDLDSFMTYAERFLEIIDQTDLIASTQSVTMVGTWIEQAKALGKNADEFSKELYEFNARSLISTWGSRYQANSLHDYSNRQWSGLTKDLYKKRWQMWIEERVKELNGEKTETIDWFEIEWEWANGNDTYPTEPAQIDMKAAATQILKEYSVENVPKAPEEDDTRDIAIANMTATAGSEQATTGSEGPAGNLLDGDTSTLWHSVWSGTDQSNLWVNLHMEEPVMVDGLRYLPRQNGTNGIITGYKIEVSQDNGVTYTEVASGTWANNNMWKGATFAEVEVSDVRLTATSSVSDSTVKHYGSGAELRLTGPEEALDLSALNKAERIIDQKDTYTTDTYSAFYAVYTNTKAIVEEETSTRAEKTAALNELEVAMNALQTRAMDWLLESFQEHVDRYQKWESNYTEAEFAIMKACLKEAAQLLEQDPETIAAADVVALDIRLLSAASALNEHAGTDVLLENLEMAIALAENILAEPTMESVRPGKVQELKDALTAAHALVKESSADADAIRQAIKAIVKASQELWQIVDIEPLVNLAELGEQKLTGTYTQDSLAALQKAITQANSVIADPDATSDQVRDAYNTLSEAIINLKELADKSALQLQISIAETIVGHLDDYVASSVAGLKDLLDEAKALMEQESASQSTINEMTERLTAANMKAQTKADKTALEDLLNSLKNMDFTLYTEESGQNLRTAMQQGMLVLNDETATAEAVKTAFTNIEDALAGLIKESNTTPGTDDQKKEQETQSKGEAEQGAATGDPVNVAGWISLLLLGAVTMAYTKKRKARN